MWYKLHGYTYHTYSEDKHLYIGGLGVSIILCSYNMLGIWMYVGQAKQFLKVRSKKIKTQHSKTSGVHGSQATIPNGNHYSHG